MVKISVIIPVSMGRDQIVSTLKNYQRIRTGKKEFEIVVVSYDTDDYLKWIILQLKPQFSLIFTEMTREGDGSAFNTGARLARGEYLFFAHQSVIPSSTILNEHLSMLKKFESTGDSVVSMGFTPYVKDFGYDSFHNYLADSRLRYIEKSLIHGDVVKGERLDPYNFMIAGKLFMESGGFDESLSLGCFAGEFGLRWVKKGNKIVFNKKAIGNRDERTNLEAYCSKMVVDGKCTYQLHIKHRDYFGKQLDHYMNMVRDCFHMKLESDIQRLINESKYAADTSILREIMEYYFFKGYYLESLAESQVIADH